MRLSTPIFMDNVVCFGSEDKLIDCSYHSDTSENDHSTDIRVQRAQTSEIPTDDAAPTDDAIPATDVIPTANAAMQESTNTISVAALTAALAVCVLIVILGAVYFVY